MPAPRENECDTTVYQPGRAAMIAALYRRCNERLLRMASRYTQDDDAVLDIVQDVYLKLLSSPLPPKRALEDAAQLDRWLLRVARNHFVDQTRRRKVEVRRLQEFAVESNAEACGDSASLAQHEIVARALARDDLSGDVLEAIAALPPRQTSVVIMRCVLGESVSATATKLSMAPGTVRATLFHARKTLQKSLVRGRSLQRNGVVRVAPGTTKSG